MPLEGHYIPLAIDGIYIDQSRCEAAVEALEARIEATEENSMREDDPPISRQLWTLGWSDAGSAYAGADERPYPRSFEVGGIWGDFVTAEDARGLLETLGPFLHRHPAAIVLGYDPLGRPEVAYYTEPDGSGGVRVVEDHDVMHEVEYTLANGRTVDGY